MKKLFCLFLLCLTVPAYANVDGICIQECLNAGRQYDSCYNQCKTDDNYGYKNSKSPYYSIPKTDWDCMISCQRNGYDHKYCKSVCTVNE